MMSWLNAASLVLGLIAWILPVIAFMQMNRKYKNWFTLSIISLSACAISICFQMYYNYHLVKIEDWAALLDTTWAVVFLSTVLLIVTILLNVSMLIVYRSRTAT
ncbi:hypothetical protein MHZ92_17975 [Sporosarcina sp. ACRSL]|uniref:hypothetical protein n=1 Tax=Sporosarcina sp. ACRSL TaxID=2918215 RepID=UPI001EF6BA57|nr:hypothetical protein [Sporosarcina sp. ACRSL]MCG7346004.1 hypothetical protein [Sporosarcina sp. ACRSL]